MLSSRLALSTGTMALMAVSTFGTITLISSGTDTLVVPEPQRTANRPAAFKAPPLVLPATPGAWRPASTPRVVLISAVAAANLGAISSPVLVPNSVSPLIAAAVSTLPTLEVVVPQVVLGADSEVFHASRKTSDKRAKASEDKATKRAAQQAARTLASVEADQAASSGKDKKLGKGKSKRSEHGHKGKKKAAKTAKHSSLGSRHGWMLTDRQGRD